MGISRAAVSQLIRIVEDKGYIARVADENDRRFIRIEMSEKGQLLIDASKRDMQNRILNSFAKMGEERTTEMIHNLKQLLILLRENTQ